MNEKHCSRCKLNKPLDQFTNDRSKPGGKRFECKACQKKYDHQYNERPERRTAQRERWLTPEGKTKRQEHRAKYNAKVKLKNTPPNNTNACVYIVQMNDIYKIGKTTSLAFRYSQLRTSLPYPITLVHTIRSVDLGQAEAHLHHVYAHRRLNGEWFALLPEEVEAIREIQEI